MCPGPTILHSLENLFEHPLSLTNMAHNLVPSTQQFTYSKIRERNTGRTVHSDPKTLDFCMYAIFYYLSG